MISRDRERYYIMIKDSLLHNDERFNSSRRCNNYRYILPNIGASEYIKKY